MKRLTMLVAMLAGLSALMIAQSEPAPSEMVRAQPVRPLTGQLDAIPVFNSNSPELIGGPGILLSTFPPAGKAVPSAHLDFAFSGRFDVFAHHVYKALSPDDLRSMYLAILVHNPGEVPVTLDILSGASYLSQPDAPFIQLPDVVAVSPNRPVFAGPGSRVMGDLLRGQRQADLPAQLVIPPGESRLLLNAPIPIATLEPPLNGRSTLMRLRSSGPVYLASLAQAAVLDSSGVEVAPSLTQWETLLAEADLGTPRDRTPTPLTETPTQVIYGRVAGVSQGSRWTTTLTDDAADYLTIPTAGNAFSYGISTLYAGRQGTGQIQSAPMQVRYPDTAYQAHGNYGVEYQLTFPLFNPGNTPQRITLALETPLKEDQLSTAGLRFLDPPAAQTFFRGPVQVRYRDDDGLPRIQTFHLVQRRGQQGAALISLTLQPQERRSVQVNLLYPPDATPPQVITILGCPLTAAACS
jgi:hypothetical protein